jgi:hypothetical protein
MVRGLIVQMLMYIRGNNRRLSRTIEEVEDTELLMYRENMKDQFVSLKKRGLSIRISTL